MEADQGAQQGALSQDLLDALNRRRGFTATTVRAVFRARDLLLASLASAIIKLRDSSDPTQILMSQIKERDLRIHQLEQSVAILSARMTRIDSRHRNHYSPEERFKILLYKEDYSLSIEQTAQLFLVSTQTITRWTDEAEKEPGKNTVGSLLKATPPLLSYQAVHRNLVLLMDQMGFGGSLRIAQTLARQGIKIGKETIRRWRKTPRKLSPQKENKGGLVLKAKHPNHIWMIDITEIKGFLGLFTYRLAVMLAVFSRMPLVAKVFISQPSGADMAAMVEYAAKKHGPPKHFVSDQGPQFTSSAFKKALAALNVKQRFGALGSSGSIAIIELFWRTTKDILLLKIRPPLTRADLHSRTQTGLLYYAYYKPHQGLAGATPAELFNGNPPAASRAVRPRRVYEIKTYESHADTELFEIAYLDPEHLLPFLIPKAAA